MDYIKFEDITMFLCENHPLNEQLLPHEIKIPTRVLPMPKMFNNSQTKRITRDIDIHAPILYKDSN